MHGIELVRQPVPDLHGADGACRELRRRAAQGARTLTLVAVQSAGDWRPGSRQAERPLGLALEPEEAPIQACVLSRCSEVVEGATGRADDVLSHESRALARTVFRILQHTFPFNDCPTGKIVLGELREDTREVDLSVSE